jgi:membrane protein YdbS with pleckstrin-like domain
MSGETVMSDDAEAAVAVVLPKDVQAAIGKQERVLFAVRPGFLSIIASSWKSMVVLAIVGGLFFLPWFSWRWGPLLSALVAVGRLVWAFAVWWNIRAVLTDQRVCVGFGVFRRGVSTLALHRVQHITLSKLLVERLMGLGTVSISSAGTGWSEVVWPMMHAPQAVLIMVREAAAACSPGNASAGGAPAGITVTTRGTGMEPGTNEHRGHA